MYQKPRWSLIGLAVSLVTCFVLMIYLSMDAPCEAEFRVLRYAREKGISIQAYPDCLIRLLETNPEAEEFVLNYPFRKETQVDLSHYDLSLGTPLLMQFDPRWGYMEYGGDMVGVSGSGAVCLAMAGYYVTGDEEFYPNRVVEIAGHFGFDSTDAETVIGLLGQTLGLEVKEIPRVERKIAAYLQAGAPIIALMGPGEFAGAGRYIVLTACEDGMLSVNDPGSYVNSGKQWSFAEIRDQIKNLWVIQPGA